MPTAANLNLYRGWNSRVGWHCDDEPLFGECGEAKLIVSVSLGTSALFKWKGKSCPDSEAHLCCLGHGDILLMDGQCQDEFVRCTDPGLEQERINVTFRWNRQHAASCALRSGVFSANVCAGFIRCCYGDCGEWWVGEDSGCSLDPVHMGGAGLAGFNPSCVQGSGYAGVPIAGHAHWAAVGGGSRSSLVCTKVRPSFWGNGCGFIGVMPKMLALVGLPGLHGYNAFLAFWFSGEHCGEIAGTFKIFLFSRNSSYRFWGQVLWHLWIGRARHPGPSSCQLGIEVFNVVDGARTGTWLWRLRLTFLRLLSTG